jgi:hypothetical protein
LLYQVPGPPLEHLAITEYPLFPNFHSDCVECLLDSILIDHAYFTVTCQLDHVLVSIFEIRVGQSCQWESKVLLLLEIYGILRGVKLEQVDGSIGEILKVGFEGGRET